MTQGELWTDFTADTAGKFRITPKNVTATMSDTTFVHAVMEVSSFATGRRYPQIMISEQDFMTSQWLLERSSSDLNATNPNSGATLVVQPFDADIGRHVVELELCDHRNWQVNDQCPWFLLEKPDPAQCEHPRPEHPPTRTCSTACRTTAPHASTSSRRRRRRTSSSIRCPMRASTSPTARPCPTERQSCRRRRPPRQAR